MTVKSLEAARKSRKIRLAQRNGLVSRVSAVASELIHSDTSDLAHIREILLRKGNHDAYLALSLAIVECAYRQRTI